MVRNWRAGIGSYAGGTPSSVYESPFNFSEAAGHTLIRTMLHLRVFYSISSASIPAPYQANIWAGVYQNLSDATLSPLVHLDQPEEDWLWYGQVPMELQFGTASGTQLDINMSGYLDLNSEARRKLLADSATTWVMVGAGPTVNNGGQPYDVPEFKYEFVLRQLWQHGI